MTSVDDALEILRTGSIEVLGLLPYSSNYTFLTRVTAGDREALAVYKPRTGERPLWDFPRGTLAAREVAAWLVSDASWKLVPPTVLRTDAPMGEGSLQLFVEHDPERHYFVLLEEGVEGLESFAAFDAVVNNADRKSGHVIEDAGGRLWAVDHGLTFHTEYKLRTVIWDFAEEPLPDRLRGDLEELEAKLSDPGGLAGDIARLLAAEEVDATLARVRTLLAEGRFPAPQGDRSVPWPLI